MVFVSYLRVFIRGAFCAQEAIKRRPRHFRGGVGGIIKKTCLRAVQIFSLSRNFDFTDASDGRAQRTYWAARSNRAAPVTASPTRAPARIILESASSWGPWVKAASRSRQVFGRTSRKNSATRSPRRKEATAAARSTPSRPAPSASGLFAPRRPQLHDDADYHTPRSSPSIPPG